LDIRVEKDEFGVGVCVLHLSPFCVRCGRDSVLALGENWERRLEFKEVIGIA